MRTIGGICIVVAAILAFAGYNHNTNANNLQAQISQQSGLTKFIGEGLQLNDIDRARIQGMRDTSKKFFAGAALFGLVGLALGGLGGSSSTVTRTITYQTGDPDGSP
jgi:hypothetical protein